MYRFSASLMGVFLFLLFYQNPAHALIEVRLNYGGQGVKPDRLHPNVPQVSSLSGWGVDAIVSLPLYPVVFGLRYEMLQDKKEHKAFGQIEVDFKRLSLLLGWRPIDRLFFVGAVGTLGLAHGGETRAMPREFPPQKFKSDISHSYSLGIEGGVKLTRYFVGAEMGTFSMIDKGTQSHQKYEGVYFKLHLGINF